MGKTRAEAFGSSITLHLRDGTSTNHSVVETVDRRCNRAGVIIITGTVKDAN